MAVEKTIGSSSLVEVIDRILDKGVVVDAWVRVSLVGIELLAIEARIVVASVETYLKYAEAIGLTAKAYIVPEYKGTTPNTKRRFSVGKISWGENPKMDGNV